MARKSTAGISSSTHQKPSQPYPLTSLGLDATTSEDLKVEDKKRNQGMYITGSQGTGKSTLLETTLYQDFVKGYSAIIIDPHGQLIDNLISRMPEHRVKDTYLLDMTDDDYPFGLNMFACEDIKSPIARGMVVDRVEHIFAKIFADSPKGLLLPKVLRTIALTFLEHQGMTLTDVHALLHDASFRRSLTRSLKNSDVKAYWDEYEQMGRSERKAEIAAINNRLPIFLTAPFVKNIVGQGTSLLDIRKAILNHEILLIKLPVKLLPYTAPIIGTMLIAYIHQATFSFQFLKEEERPGFTLVVDEFQNFATSDFAELFKEGRKYGARTLVANQDRHDLTDVNRRATLQAYTVVSFRTTPEDAADVAPKFLESRPKLRPDSIFSNVIKHLPEHDHFAVRQFYESYVLQLQQKAAGDRSSSLHSALALLNQLLFEAERKGAVNKRLRHKITGMVAGALGFASYFNPEQVSPDLKDAIGRELFSRDHADTFFALTDAAADSLALQKQIQEKEAPLASIDRFLQEKDTLDLERETDVASKLHGLLQTMDIYRVDKGGWQLYNARAIWQQLESLAVDNVRFAEIDTLEKIIQAHRNELEQKLIPLRQQRRKLAAQLRPHQVWREPGLFGKRITHSNPDDVVSYDVSMHPPINLGEHCDCWKRYGEYKWRELCLDVVRLDHQIAEIEYHMSSDELVLRYKDGRFSIASIYQQQAEHNAWLAAQDTPEKILLAIKEAYSAKEIQPIQTKLAEKDAKYEAALMRMGKQQQEVEERHHAFVRSMDATLEALIQNPLGKREPATEREMKERILTLPDYHALMRVGTTSSTVKIKRPPKPVAPTIFADRLRRIQKQTHKKYCRQRSEVEREIAARRKRGVSEPAPTEEPEQSYSRFEEI